MDLKKSLFVFLFSLFAYSIFAQHKIKIEFEDYPNDTLIIGYYYGEKTLVHDTLVKNSKKQFVLEGKDTLKHGVYMMLSKPNNEFHQFLITDDQNFNIKSTNEHYESVKFKSSEENEVFSDYLKFIAAKRREAEPIRELLSMADSLELNVDKEKDHLDRIDKEVKKRQEEIIGLDPQSLVAQLIQANREIRIPDFEGTAEEINSKKYLYYKKHFFDHIHLDKEITLRTPFIHNKINTYIQKLTPLNPDSINLAIDTILSWTRKAPETYKYYLSHFLNTYANSRTIGMDAIFVHLADNYYLNGKAPWVNEETLTKIRDNIFKIRPTLIGKIAPNIEVYREDGSPIKIDDIDYEYLILLFWAPDCGHCKEAMPDAVEFEKKYRDKGVKILAICTKHQEKTKDCWKMIDEKEMQNFINAADQFHKSRFKIKFNVSRTPKIYILDKNREILIKDLGSEHLSEIMDQIIEMNEQESN